MVAPYIPYMSHLVLAPYIMNCMHPVMTLAMHRPYIGHA
jgi:hypothetical protein